MPNEEIIAGTEFRVRYPFIRDTYTEYEQDGPCEMRTWRPGVRMEQIYIPPDSADVEAQADGEGEMILAVISVHKPGRFPTRVFYTRRWRDPAGREFGKARCMFCTLEKFRRLTRSYQHPYVVKDAGWPKSEPPVRRSGDREGISASSADA